MTNNRFISALRDYAALARARRKSYATAVHRLVELRVRAQSDNPNMLVSEEILLQRANEVAMREYGKFDPEFSIPDGN